MKPFEEKVSRERRFDYRLQRYHCEVSHFEWHYHQEYELVLYRHTEGQLFAGNYHGRYSHNSLALFGPHLPHTATLDQCTGPEPVTYVLWFGQEWIQQVLAAMPSLHRVGELLVRAGQGISFPTVLGEAVFQRIESLHSRPEAERTLEVLMILANLADSSSVQTLNPTLVPGVLTDGDRTQAVRIRRLMDYVERHYREPLTVAAVSQALNLSPSTLRRLFERHFRESFSEHLKQYRIGKACEYLVNSDTPVALIAEQVGFQNLSNFNRQFRQVKSMTPRQFRQQFNPLTHA